MEQVRNLSTSTQRVDASGMIVDTFEARTTKIRPFEAEGALGTVTTTKAPRGSGGLLKQKYVLEVP